MHAFISALHLNGSFGMAIVAVLYAVKLVLGYVLLARFRRWRAGRPTARR
jgi:hypothetical protein